MMGLEQVRRVLAIGAVLWAGAAGPGSERAMLGGIPSRNPVSAEKNLPSSFDPATGRNVKWMAELGNEAYAGPVVAGGRVFAGTNNELPRDPGAVGDRGVLMAFSAADGTFLWQSTHPKLAAGRAQDWPLQGVCSTPAIEGDRLYYLSNRGEAVALDAQGFRDGENDGPLTSEAARGERDADVVWTLDLIGKLGVVPRYMTASSPVVAGDLLFVVTGNGRGPDGKVPAPKAPSFVAIDRHTGQVRWSDASPGEDLLEGQWGSPSYGTLAGRPQVVFPGGDGRLYAFEPETGRLLWSFDANRAPSLGTNPAPRAPLIASPVLHDGRVYAALGRDPQHSAEPGRLWALDIRPAGKGRFEAVPAWSLGGADFSTTLSSVAVDGGLVYAADFAGFLRAIDAATGKVLWTYDAFAAVWGSPLLADGKIYLGDQDGDLAVLRAGRRLEVLAEVDLGTSVLTTPAARDGVLYVVTSSRLYALAAGAGPTGNAASRADPPGSPGGPECSSPGRPPGGRAR
ncbi:MAG TPA: PQQ-binding-like beta-propeller repeat protein [Thermoanaerobaculia bacterium]|nr:PQQ-binding-like beta-propeller repeat protein [Thermoanaerobaculia bacterium]